MARTALTLPTDFIPAEAPALPFDGAAASDALADRLDNYLTLSSQYGDARPYDRDRLVELAKVHARNSSEAMLELGKCLLLIREGEGQGAWEEVCERQIGIAPSVARRLIQATTKYFSPKLSHHRSALSVLGRTKLYELMVLEDEPLAALATGGSVAGLTLDAVDRMTSRELRAALRDARETVAAKERLLEVKSKKIDDLDTALAKRQPANAIPHADLEAHGLAVRAELSRRVFHCEMDLVGELPPAIEALLAHGRASGEPVHDLIAGHLGQLAGDIESLLLRYGADIPRGRATPDADIWDAVNAEIAAKAAAEEGHDPPRRIN